MENKLQALTQKIYEEGVAKAREEAAAILADARKKADEILAEARREASHQREQTQYELDELNRNVSSEIRLSARQLLSSLKQEVAQLIAFQSGTVPLAEALNSKDFLRELISLTVKNWSQNGQSAGGLTLLLPEKAREDLDAYLQADLKRQLDQGLELRFSKNLSSGFRIGPADGSYLVSFSDKEFDNLFQEYLRPRTAQLLFEGQ